MRTQEEIESVVAELYEELGGKPEEIRTIRPCDGSWGNALAYEVAVSHEKRARIQRKDLDDQNRQALLASLGGLVRS